MSFRFCALRSLERLGRVSRDLVSCVQDLSAEMRAESWIDEVGSFRGNIESKEMRCIV